MNAGPQTQIDEIAPDIYRLSTFIPEITEHGFTVNQFLLTGDEPMLFHTGMRQLFPLVSEAVNRVTPLEKLRWISFGHVEADECGSMNMFLEAAPAAEVIAGPLAVMLSLTDLCDRPPVVAPVEDVLDIGGHRLRFIPTPHVPHNWEAGPVVRRNYVDSAGRRPSHPRRRVPRAHRERHRRAGARGGGDLPCHGDDHQPAADAATAGRADAHDAGGHARLVVHG